MTFMLLILEKKSKPLCRLSDMVKTETSRNCNMDVVVRICYWALIGADAA